MSDRRLASPLVWFLLAVALLVIAIGLVFAWFASPPNQRGGVVAVGLYMCLFVIGGIVLAVASARARASRERGMRAILKRLGFAASSVAADQIAHSSLPLFSDARMPWIKTDGDWMDSGSEGTWRGRRMWFVDLSRSEDRGIEFPDSMYVPSAGDLARRSSRFGSWISRSLRKSHYGMISTKQQTLTCAIVEIALNAVPTVIASRQDLLLGASVGTFQQVAFELGDFNEAFAVLTKDVRFAHALVDQRAMEWYLRQDPGTVFEVAGSLALVCRAKVSPQDVENLLDLAIEFVDRIPGAVESMWPPATGEVVTS